MKFELENLGYLKQATIELGDLTIICGKNNTGKTYINYALYGFLETWDSNIELDIESEIDTLLENGIVKINLLSHQQNFVRSIEKICDSYPDFLPRVFNTEQDTFRSSSFKIILDDYKPDNSSSIFMSFAAPSNQKEVLKIIKNKENNDVEITLLVENQKPTLPKEIVKIMVNKGLAQAFAYNYFSEAFIITSERTGVSLFYKELNINKNIIIEQLQNKSGKFKSSDFIEMFNDSLSRYPIPIKNEIDFVRDLDDIKKEKGEVIKKDPGILLLFEDIVGGTYSIDNDSILFTFNAEQNNTRIPFHAASSTVKSLISLNFYLKHKAKPGDLLIIDEPELNLHPANQRKLAKLFSRLIKCGIKLLMTTHSDYLIKELNNLIVLNNDFESKQELMLQYNYTEDDILDKNKVKVYIADNHTLTPAKITDIGIEVGTFDTEIIEMNNFFDEATIELDAAYDL